MSFFRRPVIILFLLSPIYAEVISGATPLSAYLNPLAIIFQLAFYGSAALIIRELAQRSKNKWAAVFILGLALAILEEGVMTKVFFNPMSGVSPLVDYGRVGDLNLPLSLQLMLYHSLVSVAIPIFLTELMFPARSAGLWLTRSKIALLVGVLSITTLLGTTTVFPYPTSLIDLLGCLVAIAVLVLASKRTGVWAQAGLPTRSHQILFFLGFSYLILILAASFVLPGLKIDSVAITVFLITMGLLGTIFLIRNSLTIKSRFYLASGATIALMVFDLILAVLGRIEMIALILIVIFGLWWLKQRLVSIPLA